MKIFRDYSSSSRQNQIQLQEAAKAIVAQAFATKKPVVLERLNFKIKKAALQKQQTGQTALNKTVSALAYRAFREAIERQAMKLGVEVILVSPAYTSLIGRMKYMNNYSMSRFS